MSTDRLRIYNEALRVCGERKLASLTEARQPRYLLDDSWNNNAAQYCLEKGMWTFAMRGAKFLYDVSIAPSWGYRRGYTKPTDWVNTAALCSDEYFRVPLNSYEDEALHWFCDLDQIYVRYVSNDTAYGLDLSKWPAAFADYVSAHIASDIIVSLSGSQEERKRVWGWEERQLKNARSRDASAQPTRFPAEGSWASARHGFYTGRDNGNRGSLIG